MPTEQKIRVANGDGCVLYDLRRDALRAFRALVRVEDSNDFSVLLNFLVAALREDSSVLVITGASGTGKTLLARALKALIDPVEPNSVINEATTQRDMLYFQDQQWLSVFDTLPRDKRSIVAPTRPVIFTSLARYDGVPTIFLKSIPDWERLSEDTFWLASTVAFGGVVPRCCTRLAKSAQQRFHPVGNRLRAGPFVKRA